MLNVDFTDNFTWISCCQGICRNGFGHNASCTDHASPADSDARQDDYSSADPASVFNGDRQGVCMPDIFDSVRRFGWCQTLVQLYGMCRRINLHIKKSILGKAPLSDAAFNFP